MRQAMTTAPLLSSYTGWPVIIGSGLAGLSVALHLKQPCLLLSPHNHEEGSSTQLAQGGMAAAIGADDSPDDHARDTLKAGAGLCDEAVVHAITKEGPQTVETLLRWGVPLTHEGSQLALHLEGAHSHPRVVYAGGDQSGAYIASSLWKRVLNTPRIHVLTGQSLEGLHCEDGLLRGVWVSDGFIPTQRCILATGSCGGLYRHTTIPLSNKGMGIAYAAQAGARLADMEFTQFHPTALAAGPAHARRSLISEAVRGAGARLVLDNGDRFTEELAPRDVVSRAIAAQLTNGRHVYLDGRHLPNRPFSVRFPSITRACLAVGLNPDTHRLPVKPAMHYHMGGIAVDQHGRSSIPGLWAVGEVACTGLHGANRLASNSLLEAFVCGKWTAEDLDGHNTPLMPISVPSRQYPLLAHTWEHMDHMENLVGILRDEQNLRRFLDMILPDARQNGPALTAFFIAWAALNRAESRGSHWRSDAPYPLTPPQRHSWSLVDLPTS